LYTGYDFISQSIPASWSNDLFSNNVNLGSRVLTREINVTHKTKTTKKTNASVKGSKRNILVAKQNKAVKTHKMALVKRFKKNK